MSVTRTVEIDRPDSSVWARRTGAPERPAVERVEKTVTKRTASRADVLDLARTTVVSRTRPDRGDKTSAPPATARVESTRIPTRYVPDRTPARRANRPTSGTISTAGQTRASPFTAGVLWNFGINNGLTGGSFTYTDAAQHQGARRTYHSGFYDWWRNRRQHMGAIRFQRHLYWYPYWWRQYHRPRYVSHRYPWWWYGYGRSSYFRIGYYDDHWSVRLSYGLPYIYCRPQVVYEPYYVYREVTYVSPRVEVITSYDGIARVIDMLKYGGVGERREAAQDLGRRGSLRGLYPLIYALEYDEDALVRFYAARSLGTLGDRDALPVLRRAIKEDADEFVQVAASDAIELILN